MKSVLKFTAAAATLLMTMSIAQADSIKVTSDELVVKTGAKTFPLTVEGSVGFTPKDNTISLKIAGMMCTFGSSTQGSVPKGCNYQVVISADNVTAVPTQASSICMQIEAQCK
ncbi:MAG: hypothetical protein JJ858_09195 [Rhizobiaceae bacterium]|nr:hypothetical protein [Rhizobiaceae bacterium]